MFKGFSVPAGKGRFDEKVQLGGEPNDCKVSSQDTRGATMNFYGRAMTETNRHANSQVVGLVSAPTRFGL